jgi:hypothetical protein
MNYAPGSTPNPDPNATGPYAGQVPPDPAAPGYVPVPPFTPQPSANMAAAVLLGFIPGVGAMYNGQYAKALAHVVIFVVLVSMANTVNDVFGVFVAAWIAYMVFDSYHTARARRDGLPLPNALGLNDVGAWFQNPSQRASAAQPPFATGFTSAPPPPPPGAYYAPPIPPVPPVPPMAAVDPAGCSSCPSRPTGAIILIVLGVIFLLSTFGILSGRWIEHGWPLVVIGFGVFMLIRRLQPRADPRGVDQGGMR